jgi:hypothetical protein
MPICNIVLWSRELRRLPVASALQFLFRGVYRHDIFVAGVFLLIGEKAVSLDSIDNSST